MDCKDTDFFFKLYEIVESHRIVVQIHLDDIFLKERFDMVNQSQKNLPQSDKKGFFGFSPIAYLRKID